MEEPKHNYFKDKESRSLSPNKTFLLIAIPVSVGVLLMGVNKLYDYIETTKTPITNQTPPINKIVTTPNYPKGVNFYNETQKPYVDEIRDKLSEGQFEELDKIADSLRASKETFPGGSRKLGIFYDALSFLNENGNDEFWQINIKTLENWCNQRPDSITAKVALADLLHQFAWKARGTSYSSGVSDENFRLFQERLEKSEEILNQAKKLSTKCPGWYVCMLAIAHSTGWEKQRFNRLFEEATKFDPYYQSFYRSKVVYLLPQWYGEEKDLDKFAAETYQRFPGKEGAILYQTIADEINQHSSNKDYPLNVDVSWEKIKEGFLAREELYGANSAVTNEFCQFAILANDKETAKTLFQKIGDKWDTSIWKNYKEFQEAKAKVNS